MPEIKARTVVVTGSTSGIGLGIARAFAAEGANVVINGFGKADEIEVIRRKLEEEGATTALYHPADMTKPDEIGNLIATASDKFGASMCSSTMPASSMWQRSRSFRRKNGIS